jgi:hypothetical protein
LASELISRAANEFFIDKKKLIAMHDALIRIGSLFTVKSSFGDR